MTLPTSNTRSNITLWPCGLNLEHHHMCPYFSFQTGCAGTICTFEVQAYKENSAEATNPGSSVNKENYIVSFFLLTYIFF